MMNDREKVVSCDQILLHHGDEVGKAHHFDYIFQWQDVLNIHI